jgi:hypothetical protein
VSVGGWFLVGLAIFVVLMVVAMIRNRRSR